MHGWSQHKPGWTRWRHSPASRLPRNENLAALRRDDLKLLKTTRSDRVALVVDLAAGLERVIGIEPTTFSLGI